MKAEPIRLTRRYVTALRKHLTADAPAIPEPARRLGRQAVADGLGTLGLAKIHEEALAGLMQGKESPKARASMTGRAELFFKEANSRIEETQHAAAHGRVQMSELRQTLSQRTAELAAANRRLQQGVAQRKIMEDAFEKRRKLHNECLEESLRLQKRLRQLTHRLLAAQEDERKSISRELQDEIAQTLLGINVRLLSLKEQARGNTKRLKNEIASTQRLVVESAGSVRRVAEKLGTHETQASPLVATVPGGITNASKARQAGKDGFGAKSGRRSHDRRTANAGSRQDS